MDRVITVVEAEDDSDVVGYYQRFIISNLSDGEVEKSHPEDGTTRYGCQIERTSRKDLEEIREYRS